MFTTAEKEARYAAVGKVFSEDDFKALLLIGDTNVSFGFCGDMRYYTNNRVTFYRQVVVLFPDSDPVHFANSEISRQAAERRSFVEDCRVSENLKADVSDLLKERGISAGRIGVNFEMLPVAWYRFLKQELPQIQWVETHDRIMEIRFQRSQEEADVYRRGAALGDGGFEAALEVIQPGASAYEIVAAIEYFARSRGAEEHFTLIASGKFSFGEDNTLPLVYAPSGRRIEGGDSVQMEITPRYEGYWTQLVRTVNVGKPNHDLEEIQKVCRDAIKSGLEKFAPGRTIRDVALAMEAYVTGCGYLLKPPLGHFCGVDLVEARVTPENEMVLTPGMAVIIHPTVVTPDDKHNFFWGETYLVTREGYERLHRTGDELLTV